MKDNISSDSDNGAHLRVPEQNKNGIEIEGSKESFLSYLLNKYNQDERRDKGEFS